MAKTRSDERRVPHPAPSAGPRLRDDPRLREPGWVLLPLRVFLGVTFVYAGLSKLLDGNYLDSGSAVGVHAQMLRAAAGSPIGALIRLSASHATTTGLLIAFGELAVGIGVLLGLMTRIAALGGLVLALSFYLSVSWQTSPYFYGADIVFLFAWTPLVFAGDGGVLSLTEYVRSRERESLLPATRPKGRQAAAMSVAAMEAEVERRTVLRTGALAGAIGGVAVVGGGALAMSRTGHTPGGATAAGTAGTAGGAGGTPPPATGTAGATATPAPGVIAAVASVPVGGSVGFTAQDGSPAYLLHPAANTFRALSAVCTHQGCTVQFDGSGFQCPCHGASFDQTGQVTGGPAQSPLPEIKVKVVGGNVVAG